LRALLSGLGGLGALGGSRSDALKFSQITFLMRPALQKAGSRPAKGGHH